MEQSVVLSPFPVTLISLPQNKDRKSLRPISSETLSPHHIVFANMALLRPLLRYERSMALLGLISSSIAYRGVYGQSLEILLIPMGCPLRYSSKTQVIEKAL